MRLIIISLRILLVLSYPYMKEIMKDFTVIDFETANPQRVSACAIGYARVANSEIIENNAYLIKPVGGHAAFQSKIHGIKEEHTRDKPDFLQLYPEISGLFSGPIVAHSLFDKQVLGALSGHFNLGIKFTYTDSSAVAKQMLPNLKNFKLTTLAKHYSLESFRHHDPKDDAMACAQIFMRLMNEGARETPPEGQDPVLTEFHGLAKGILADESVNYKEACQLLYWLEDHSALRDAQPTLYSNLKDILSDGKLDLGEAAGLRNSLQELTHKIVK